MQIIRAINFSALKHKGQTRKISGLPYIIHPMIVSQLIIKYKPNSSNLEDLQCALILHDVLEDTDATFEEIEREFNCLIASIVVEMTSDPIAIGRMGKNNYLKDKMLHMSKYSFICKLCDRLGNILDSPQIKYVQDTIDLINYVRRNRKGQSDNQIALMNKILSTCNNITKEKE